MELSQLNTFLWFLSKYNFLEYQTYIVLLRDLLPDFFRLRWASSPNQFSSIISTTLAILQF